MPPNLGITAVSEIEICWVKGIISMVPKVMLMLDLLFDDYIVIVPRRKDVQKTGIFCV